MSSHHLIRIAAVIGGCLAATAFAGLPWADASSSHAAAAKASKPKLLCVRYDSDDTPQCLRSGPRGIRGPRGKQGPAGLRGLTGPAGLTGAIGAVGLQGPTGAQGIQGFQGIQGAQGPPGAFAAGGADPGGNLVIVQGTKIGPFTFTTDDGRGTELTPSVADCPLSGPDREAYDGGATITTANPNQPGPTGDVVGMESSFPGHQNGPTEVDPLPPGAPPGGVSPEPADAYEVQAEVTHMNLGDNVTVQAYVVCGP